MPGRPQSSRSKKPFTSRSGGAGGSRAGGSGGGQGRTRKGGIGGERAGTRGRGASKAANQWPKPPATTVRPRGESRKPSNGTVASAASGGGGTGVRLQKVLAEAGIASRRECEQMIEAGRVEVNGTVRNELPVFVDPRKDRITVDGRWIEKPKGSKSAERIYVMLNKPDNTLCTTRDEQPLGDGGRKTVVDLVKHHTGARLFPIGRMDYHATGLVILTNDGLLGERLTHAKYGMGKLYRVVVGGTVSEDQIEILKRRIGKRDAVDGEGKPTGGVVVTNAPDMNTRGAPVENTTLEITLREGRTDPIDEVIVQTGLRIRRIGRVGIGPLRMTGVKIGEWRNLTKDEVRTLMEATGLQEPEKPRSRGRHSNKRPEGSGGSGGSGGWDESGGDVEDAS